MAAEVSRKHACSAACVTLGSAESEQRLWLPMTLNPSALWLFLIPYVMETMWLLSVFDLCGGVKGLVSTTCFCPAPAHLFILFHFCLSAFFFCPTIKSSQKEMASNPQRCCVWASFHSSFWHHSVALFTQPTPTDPPLKLMHLRGRHGSCLKAVKGSINIRQCLIWQLSRWTCVI